MHPVNILLIFVFSIYSSAQRRSNSNKRYFSSLFFLQLGHPVDEKLTWKDQIKNT
jgi:hypothetical protein